jgi:hypothetical protein
MRPATTRISPPPRERGGRCSLFAVLLWLALPLVAACTKKDYKSELDRVHSWTATTRLAADRRLNGATNAAVASQLADRAIEASVEAVQSLSTLAKTDAERAAARDALDSLRQGIVQLEWVNR